MLSKFILSERDLHDNELFMIVRSVTLHGPTSRSTVEHPIARLARWTGPVTRGSVKNALRRSSLRRRRKEKALIDAAAATAASMAHQDEVAASSTNPDTTAHPGTAPMNVEFPKEAVVPETSTGGAASSSMGQFCDTPGCMEISETDLKRSEFEEVPESRKVRRINGLVVCSTDIVGAAQADYDNSQLSGQEFERKADEESDAVHTHEGEPMESFEVPISRETSLE